jgi:hypothetical protein
MFLSWGFPVNFPLNQSIETGRVGSSVNSRKNVRKPEENYQKKYGYYG